MPDAVSSNASDSRSARQRRRAEQLRANLLRRKEQMRAREAARDARPEEDGESA